MVGTGSRATSLLHQRQQQLTRPGAVCAVPSCCARRGVMQGDLFVDVGASIGDLVQQGAQQLGDALKTGKIVSLLLLAAAAAHRQLYR